MCGSSATRATMTFLSHPVYHVTWSALCRPLHRHTFHVHRANIRSAAARAARSSPPHTAVRTISVQSTNVRATRSSMPYCLVCSLILSHPTPFGRCCSPGPQPPSQPLPDPPRKVFATRHTVQSTVPLVLAMRVLNLLRYEDNDNQRVAVPLSVSFIVALV